ncbi:hypothetical protein PENARI_c016G00736 [Penicillium arizonense]|uniref:mannosyl-oligosaccharide 1,2-alpha-mannosidase n=1 Tax=Penicillium arizonense TaxID=1835702 RepID=A0A1F5LBA0_PENAI|nr:hypothetical protein PENARI_c016G00736 [Penicillium arizonense]OGE50503.1 hypothetical protein PENARI_c016G00736 [Penicillium arizonense]
MSDFRYFPAWLNRHMVCIPHYGDTRWQEYNWEIFQALDTHRSAAVPYAEISDVNAPGGGELVNLVSSFYFVEVLKYLYLSFTETGVLSLDEWVSNTESHPYLIQSKYASS